MNKKAKPQLRRIEAEAAKDAPKSNEEGAPYCSFCLRSHDEIGPLIAGPSVFICRECNDMCKGIFSESE